MKTKWLVVGGMVLAAAVVGGIVAVFLVGRPGDSPVAGPGPTPDVQANPSPAAPGGEAADGGLRELDERMAFRVVPFTYKKGTKVGEKFDFTGSQPSESRHQAAAARRLRPGGATYYVVIENGGNGDLFLVHPDAAALAEYLEAPVGHLPAGALKGEAALTERAFTAVDAFRREPKLFFGLNPATGVINGDDEHDGLSKVYGINAGDRPYWFHCNPKALAAAIRLAMKDVETLKTYPVKR